MALWFPSFQFLRWVSHNLVWRQPHLRHPLRPSFGPLRTTTSVPRNTTTCASPSTAASLQPLPSSPEPRLSGAHLARPSTHFATRGSSKRGSPHGTYSCLSTFFSPSALFSLTPCFHTDKGPPPVVQCWSSSCTLPACHSASLSHPALFSSVLRHFLLRPFPNTHSISRGAFIGGNDNHELCRKYITPKKHTSSSRALSHRGSLE